jgi:predicted phage terminase large subunit-like protein
MAETPTREIRPQPGFQENWLSSPADIVIAGGAAGCGKTFGLLAEPLRHVGNGEFGAVIFRRTSPQIFNEGGLWDEASRLYPLLGAQPKVGDSQFLFPSGATVSFKHLQHEHTVLDWQGSAVPLIGFDELTHFTKYQFFYMLSRNRTMCGVRPYVRATCNPDADSWVAEFIAWWIDQDTGFPIPERAGVLRWFIRRGDAIIWGDSREELVEKYGNEELPPDHDEQPQPKSVTFIPGKLTDNPALMKADPGYKANLLALPEVEQKRLLGGNWKIRPASGMYFKRAWVEVIEPDEVPADLKWVRYWDLAATEKNEDNDPDWTVGLKMGYSRETKIIVIAHVERMQSGPGDVETAIKNTAKADGRTCRVGLPQDPGQAGKAQANYMVKQLAGFSVGYERETGDKVTRFGPFSSQAKAGNVKVVRGLWNDAYFACLEGFPEAAHDDDADASAGAYEMHLNRKNSIFQRV